MERAFRHQSVVSNVYPQGTGRRARPNTKTHIEEMDIAGLSKFVDGIMGTLSWNEELNLAQLLGAYTVSSTTRRQIVVAEGTLPASRDLRNKLGYDMVVVDITCRVAVMRVDGEKSVESR